MIMYIMSPCFQSSAAVRINLGGPRVPDDKMFLVMDSGGGGPLDSGPPGLCLPCPPHRYATGASTSAQCRHWHSAVGTVPAAKPAAGILAKAVVTLPAMHFRIPIAKSNPSAKTVEADTFYGPPHFQKRTATLDWIGPIHYTTIDVK